MYKEVEADVSALTRRIMLMEEEAKKSEQTLADTVTRLANKSKEADSVLKKAKVFESKCMNNEVTIEEYDKNLRQTTKMASDNEQKLDELTRNSAATITNWIAIISNSSCQQPKNWDLKTIDVDIFPNFNAFTN